MKTTKNLLAKYRERTFGVPPLFLLAAVLGLLSALSCGDGIEKRTIDPGAFTTLKGVLSLGQLNIHSDILFGINKDLRGAIAPRGKVLSDLSLFHVSVGGQEWQLRSTGEFILENIPPAGSYRVRIVLTRNPNLVFEKVIESGAALSGTQEIQVDLKSTAISAILDVARAQNRKISAKDLTFSQILPVLEEMTELIEGHPEEFNTPGVELIKIESVRTAAAKIAGQFTVDGQDAPVTDFTPPTFSAIETITSANSVLVTWLTNEPATSQVRYGIASQSFPTSTAIDTELVTRHEVVIQNLEKDQFYYYRVVSLDSAGNQGLSEVASFFISKSGASFYRGSVNSGQSYDFSGNGVPGNSANGDGLFTILAVTPPTVRVTFDSEVDWRFQKKSGLSFSSSLTVDGRQKIGWDNRQDLLVGELFAFADQENKRGLAKINGIDSGLITFEFLYPLSTTASTLATGTATFVNREINSATASFDFSEKKIVGTKSGNLSITAVSSSTKPYYKANLESQFKIARSATSVAKVTAGVSTIAIPQVIDESTLGSQEILLEENVLYYFSDESGRFGVFRINDQQPFNGVSFTGSLKLDFIYQPAFLEGTTQGSQFLE